LDFRRLENFFGEISKTVFSSFWLKELRKAIKKSNRSLPSLSLFFMSAAAPSYTNGGHTSTAGVTQVAPGHYKVENFPDKKSFANDGTKSDGTFRVQAKQYFLTYKTHIDKAKFRSFLESVLASSRAKKKNCVLACYVAHEAPDHDDAEHTPYEHSHCLFKLQSKFETQKASIFDIEGIHPHISVVKSWDAACVYLKKEDAECRDDINAHEKSAVVTGGDILAAYKTVHEAMAASPLHQANAIKALYDCRAAVTVAKICIELLPWQVTLGVFAAAMDDRKILWLCDIVGAAGKSLMMDYLGHLGDKNWLVIRDFGRGGDFPCILANAIQNGSWTGYGVLIDLPRSAESFDCYRHFEMARSRTITATKYKSCCVQMPYCAKVVVMANWYPDVDKMTKDRWDIHRLGHVVGGIERHRNNNDGWTAAERPCLSLIPVHWSMARNLRDAADGFGPSYAQDYTNPFIPSLPSAWVPPAPEIVAPWVAHPWKSPPEVTVVTDWQSASVEASALAPSPFHGPLPSSEGTRVDDGERLDIQSPCRGNTPPSGGDSLTSVGTGNVNFGSSH